MSGDWRDAAACRSADPALFFGPEGESPAATVVREAEANTYCAVCPVRSECLEAGLRIKYGTWGGLNEQDRANEARRRRRAAQRRAA
jgi:WhiB family redox-sensing transcriptional regulator